MSESFVNLWCTKDASNSKQVKGVCKVDGKSAVNLRRAKNDFEMMNSTFAVTKNFKKNFSEMMPN